MRVSKLFFQTFREAPADADIVSHQLMLRAGLIHQIAAGIFDFLPMALRTKHKIEDIFREEMDAIGGQEVTLPVVHPAELWQKTGRWYQIGSDMARFKDRNDRDMVLAMTHEEIMADLAKKYIKSYRQLPTMLYQIQTKFRDEPRPRAGLLRVREFTMKDAYTFDRDEAGIDAYYPHFYQAYFNIFRRSGIDVVAVKSDTGMMGGRMAHEFMALTDIGEDTLVLCDACGYSANRQVATFQGTRGMIRLEGGPFNANVNDLAEVELHQNGNRVVVERFPTANQYKLQVEAFGRTVREGAAYPCPLEFVRGTQAMMDRVYEVAVEI